MSKLCLPFVLLGLLLPACDSGSDPEQDSSAEETDCAGECGDDPVRAALESECRDACDELWVPDCITNDEHSECWEVACNEAPNEELEAFAECADDNLPECSPECLAGLLTSVGVVP